MSTKHGHTIKVNTDIVATMVGDLKAMIPCIYMFWDRVVNELIRPMINLPPDSDERCTSSASSTSSNLNVDDSSGESAENRYVHGKRKSNMKSVSLYVRCLKKNSNNNCPL